VLSGLLDLDPEPLLDQPIDIRLPRSLQVPDPLPRVPPSLAVERHRSIPRAVACELRHQQVHVKMNLAGLIPSVDRPDRTDIQARERLLERPRGGIVHQHFRPLATPFRKQRNLLREGERETLVPGPRLSCHGTQSH
jgi:hypothetical protein